MNNTNKPSEFTNKLKRGNWKTYIFCGIVVTFLIVEFVIIRFGKFLAVAVYPFINNVTETLFGGIIGKGGVELLGLYSLFTVLMLFFFLLLFIIKPWRPYFKAFSTKPSGNKPHMLLIGLLIGFAMNALCILVAVITSSIQLEFAQFNIAGFALFLVFVLIQSSYEEMVCRGFAYQRLKRTYNTTVAIIAASSFFSLAHIFNPGITPLALLSIFLIGVLYSLMVRYLDSIWIAMGAHAGWNFTQNILFGLPNSGNPSSYSIFQIVGNTTNSIAYDTVFGVESSIFAVVLEILCIVGLWLWGRRHGKQQDFDIWENENNDTLYENSGNPFQKIASWFY